MGPVLHRGGAAHARRRAEGRWRGPLLIPCRACSRKEGGVGACGEGWKDGRMEWEAWSTSYCPPLLHRYGAPILTPASPLCSAAQGSTQPATATSEMRRGRMIHPRAYGSRSRLPHASPGGVRARAFAGTFTGALKACSVAISARIFPSRPLPGQCLQVSPLAGHTFRFGGWLREIEAEEQFDSLAGR